MQLKKKIFFLLPDLYYGGAQKTFCNIINFLAKNHLDKYEFYLISINKSDKIFELDKSIHLIELNSKRSIFSLFKLIKLFFKLRPSYVFSTTLHINLISILLKKILLNINFKLIIRESNPSFFRNDVNKFLKILIKLSYNHSDHIICLSEFVENDIKKNINIKNTKISTIYNPININEILIKSTLNKDLNFSKKEFNLIYTGRLSVQKNVLLLVDVIKNIKNLNIKLRIIGNGEHYNELKRKIKLYNLKNKIEIIDFQKNPYPYIKNSDLFLLPSKWEGFGHVIAESILLDTPVIAINTIGIAPIFFKSNYFKLIENENLENLSKDIKKSIVSFKNNKIENDKLILNYIDVKKISLEFLQLIEN